MVSQAEECPAVRIFCWPQDVADALGDTLDIVQRHYAGKSEERTARTNEAIQSTWENDPTLKRAHAQNHGAHKVLAFGQRNGQATNGYAVGYAEKR